MVKVLNNTVFRFSGSPRQAPPGFCGVPGVVVGEHDTQITIRSRTVDPVDVMEFRRIIGDNESSLISLNGLDGSFYLSAHGDRQLFLGEADKFPASIFIDGGLDFNMARVMTADIRSIPMPKTLGPGQWGKLMGLAEESDFLDDETFNGLMENIWSRMGLTVHEVTIVVVIPNRVV